jgi:hypothetical protein
MDGPLANSAFLLLILHTLHFVDYTFDKPRTFAHPAGALFSVDVTVSRSKTSRAHDQNNASYDLHSRPLPSL